MVETRCPICKQVAEPDRGRNPHAPFCSKRCKTVDLGRWLGEGYRIPADEQTPTGDEGTDPVPPRGER